MSSSTWPSTAISEPARRRGGSLGHFRLIKLANLSGVTDALTELTARLNETVERLRAGTLEPDAALMLIEECARLASEASSQVDERVRAVLEPLPDLPGQLPLPAG
jgi:hypothetical protein